MCSLSSLWRRVKANIYGKRASSNLDSIASHTSFIESLLQLFIPFLVLFHFKKKEIKETYTYWPIGPACVTGRSGLDQPSNGPINSLGMLLVAMKMLSFKKMTSWKSCFMFNGDGEFLDLQIHVSAPYSAMASWFDINRGCKSHTCNKGLSDFQIILFLRTVSGYIYCFFPSPNHVKKWHINQQYGRRKRKVKKTSKRLELEES